MVTMRILKRAAALFVFTGMALSEGVHSLIAAADGIHESDRGKIDFGRLVKTLEQIQSQVRQVGSMDQSLVAEMRSQLDNAHQSGIPLGPLMYPTVQEMDPLRQLVIQRTHSAFWIKGGIGWAYLPVIVQSLLAARDAPMEVFTEHAKDHQAALINWQLESKFRYAMLECLHRLIYAGETDPPKREGYNDDRYGPLTCRNLLQAGLALATVSDDKKAMLKMELAKVDTYLVNQPPYSAKSWQNAAVRQLARMKANESDPVETKKTSTAVSVPNSSEHAKPNVFAIVLIAVAFFGLVWLWAQYRQKG